MAVDKPKIGRGVTPKQPANTQDSGIVAKPSIDKESAVYGLVEAKKEEPSEYRLDAVTIKIDTNGDLHLKDGLGFFYVLSGKTSRAVAKYIKEAMQVNKEYLI